MMQDFGQELAGWIMYLLSNLPSAGVLFNVFFILIIVWYVKRQVDSEKTPIKWSEALSSKGSDGKEHFDWNKVGQGTGVLLSVSVPFYYIHSDKADALGIMGVTGICLLYLASVKAFIAYFKSKSAKNDEKEGILK